MRLLFAGTPEVAATALRALLTSHHEVAAVLTRPDALSGRGRIPTPSPVARLAAESGIPTLRPGSLRDADVREQIAAIRADCAPVVAYGALIAPDLLALPRHGWINLHFSLLPAWRGAAPVQQAIRHGADVTGVSVFALDEGMDTGPVYAAEAEAIQSDDTAGSLMDRLAVKGARLLIATLDAVESGRAQAVPQSGEPSYAPKLSTDDAHVRWDGSAEDIDRQVRSCTPDPGAWSEFREERLGLGPVTVAPGPTDLPAGAISVRKHEVLVGTATLPVLLGLVRPSGRRAMPAADWARGVRLVDGEVLA